MRQFGIRVSVIEPGFTRTSIDKNAQVASQPVAAYASDRDRVICPIRQNNVKGKNPADVALVVLDALSSRSPRPVYLAGRDVKL
jgi:NAD(P)-dependent dehydrogenase (short-subunit alcohol dehydrogenase family)